MSLYTAFKETADRYRDQIALKGQGGLGRQYTYSEVASTVERLAGALSGPDFADCGEIGLLSENRPEWAMAYLAIVAAGKTVVPIDAKAKPAETAYIIEHSGIRALFTSGKFEADLRKDYQNLRLLSFEEESPDFWVNLTGSEGQLPTPSGDRVAVLIYTSGTTGDPKAVQLTHRNLLANIEGIRPALPFGPDDIFLSLLPLHHTFEATCGFLVPLMSGATIVYARSWKSKEIYQDISANKTTVMCGVPLLYENMYHTVQRGIRSASIHRRIMFSALFALSGLGWLLGGKWGKLLFKGVRARAGMQSMRMFVSGGAALPPQISRFFNLIGLDLQQGYGMTECSPVISVNSPDDNKFGSVGPPLPNLEVRICEPGENGVGEILVRGDSITPGYKDKPEETAELIKDGWLYTGDLGKLAKGHLWITGRKKNLIVSAAGKNIYPEQIEEALLGS